MLASRSPSSLAAPERLGFDRFILLSGCGWLLDTGLLLCLVRFAQLPTGVANVVSSAAAATVVFILSRRWIHGGASNGLATRLSFYLIYTAVVILLASFAIGLIDSGLTPWLSQIGPAWLSTLAAKMIITPPQLVCNFWVSRYFARLTLRG